MDEKKFIKGVHTTERTKGREESGGIGYASCTSILIALKQISRQ